jgi:hypothetical protein
VNVFPLAGAVCIAELVEIGSAIWPPVGYACRCYDQMTKRGDFVAAHKDVA